MVLSFLKLHHIGYLVKDIGIAATDFQERFGYSTESDIIEDPIQTAFVQFLRLSETPFWLELIMPNLPTSKLTNALRKGGGLHHLCYEAPDVSHACEQLRSKSMLMISGPTPAIAFPGRRIAWLIDASGMLVELLETGSGRLSLASLAHENE